MMPLIKPSQVDSLPGIKNTQEKNQRTATSIKETAEASPALPVIEKEQQEQAMQAFLALLSGQQSSDKPLAALGASLKTQAANTKAQQTIETVVPQQQEVPTQPIQLYNPFQQSVNHAQAAETKQTTAALQKQVAMDSASDNAILAAIQQNPALAKILQQPAAQQNTDTNIPQLSQLMQSANTSQKTIEIDAVVTKTPVTQDGFALAPQATQQQLASMQNAQPQPFNNTVTAQQVTEKNIAFNQVTADIAIDTKTAVVKEQQQNVARQQIIEQLATLSNDAVEDSQPVNLVAAQQATTSKQLLKDSIQMPDERYELQSDALIDNAAAQLSVEQPNLFNAVAATNGATTFNTADVTIANDLTNELDLAQLKTSEDFDLAFETASAEKTEAAYSDLEENPFEWLETIQRQNNLSKTAVHKAAQQLMGQPTQPAHEQIALQMRKAVDSGTDQLRLQLSPASLGHVEMNMTIAQDGTVQAVLAVERHDTYEWLKKDMANLEQLLADSGLNTQNGGLSLEYRDRQQQLAQQQNNDWQVQETVSVEAEPVARPAAYQPYITSSGVDVRI